MASLIEPNTDSLKVIESNAELLFDASEGIVAQTVEYTEGSGDQSPYFIPSSMCD
jgi:hypothetical protein